MTRHKIHLRQIRVADIVSDRPSSKEGDGRQKKAGSIGQKALENNERLWLFSGSLQDRISKTLKHEKFTDRIQRLPRLGIGVSTEFGAFRAENSLDIGLLRRQYPQFAQFLEVGVELRHGLDRDTENWVRAQLPTTYHFLDLNLFDSEHLSETVLRETKQLVERLNATWVCGDAGMWFFGQQHPLHMTLLPPILTSESAQEYISGIVKCREILGKEVIPENPPGSVFVGDLDLLSFFGEVCVGADTGMLLDAAHLAIYQSLNHRQALYGLDRFPLERIVELHVAGSTPVDVDGLTVWTDDHRPEVRSETWQIAEFVIQNAPNLKAIVFECERNPLESCLPGFRKLQEMWDARSSS